MWTQIFMYMHYKHMSILKPQHKYEQKITTLYMLSCKYCNEPVIDHCYNLSCFKGQLIIFNSFKIVKSTNFLSSMLHTVYMPVHDYCHSNTKTYMYKSTNSIKNSEQLAWTTDNQTCTSTSLSKFLLHVFTGNIHELMGIGYNHVGVYLQYYSWAVLLVAWIRSP